MEKAYLDMDALRVSYGPHGNNSHKNSWAIDLAGKDTGISNLLAPFSGYVKRIRTNSNELWFESAEPVLWADGTQDYVTIMMIHANSVPVTSGQYVKQGALLYSEGTKGNASGNHIHFEVGKGKFVSPYGWYSNGRGDDGSEVWNIYNQVDPTRVFFIKPSCTIMDPGTDNTSGKSLVWTVDNGSSIGNMDPNTYFTVGVGNMEYFSDTNVYTNLGYLENGRTYIAYDSYVGSDFTWWRFRHPNGNLYWTAMIWDRCTAYGTMSSTQLEDKMIYTQSETQLYYTCDPFNPATAVLASQTRTKAVAKANLKLYDKEWCSVSIGGTEYWVPLSDSVTLVDSDWNDLMVTLPAGSTLTVIAESVYTYSEPNPSKSNGSIPQGTVLNATRQSSTGIMGYSWYEAVGLDGKLVYIVVNNSQVTVDKTGSGGGTGGGDGGQGGGDDTPTDPPSGGDTDYTINATGIDVSKYQGEINWNSVKADSQKISFAFIRAVSTASSLYVDPYLVANMQGAEKCGIPYGVYIFTYAEDEENINAEVDLCLDQLTGFSPTYPVAWDVEADFFKNAANKDANTELILYALRRIQNYGYYPILYTYYNMIMNYIDYKKILEYGFDIWIADYRGYNGFAQYGTATIWQYSSSGSVSGISGNVDMDISYFDYDRYITDVGFNLGAGSKYPSTPMNGYLTVNVTNAEAFPYPSVNAEGNYYLMNGASYSIVGKCNTEIDGFTWYLIKDNGHTYYVPYIADRMSVVEGNFITSQYRFIKTRSKTWISNYETMELFSEPNIYAQFGYMVKNSPYEVFGILVDPITIDGYDFIFVIVKNGDAYAYCVDFSKDAKCFIYESEVPYPLDIVASGSKLTTNGDWIGYWKIPSTYDAEAVGFMEKGKKYTILGKVRYAFDKKKWYAIEVDGTEYFVINDDNVKVTTDDYNIPYSYAPFTETTYLEVCSAANSYESCDTSSVATPLLIDKVYTLYGKITDSSVSGDWYIALFDNTAKYILVENGNCNVYTGTPYPRNDVESNFVIIPNVSLPYYNAPTTSDGVSTVLGYFDAGTIIYPNAQIIRPMVGGVFFVYKLDSGDVYFTPEGYQCYCDVMDTYTDKAPYGMYIQTVNGINGYRLPHSYVSPSIRIPANTRLDNVRLLKNSADGITWYYVWYNDFDYWIMVDSNITFGYSYPITDLGSNFKCISETEDILIYEICEEESDYLIGSVKAPGNVTISGMVSEVIDGMSWYSTILEDGTTGYIPALDDYTFDYQYILYKLGDYAWASVTQTAPVYNRPDENSINVRDLEPGTYPIEFMAGGSDDTTVSGTWLQIGDEEYVKVSSTTTLVYKYPSNIVSKFLTINVTGKDGLKAYKIADPTTSYALISYGISLKPTTTFDANGYSWYGVVYGGSVYYVLTTDPNLTTTNEYDQNPVIEGFSADVMEDGVVCYKEPNLSSEQVPLEIGDYPISSKLIDEIDKHYWYSLMIDGSTYYIPQDAADVYFVYIYPSEEVEKGTYLRPLIEDYAVYDNPVEPSAVGYITNTSVEVISKVTKIYNGMTWYLVYFDDDYYYAPINSDCTNAILYNPEADNVLASLKEIKSDMEKEKDQINSALSDIDALTASLSTLKSTVSDLGVKVNSNILEIQDLIDALS